MAEAGRGLARAGRLLAPLLQPLAAVLTALAAGVLIILAIGKDPVSAYQNFLVATFTSRVQFGNMLATATPLVFTGLAVALSFQAGVFNIGAEGQLYLGAFWAAVTAVRLAALPAPLAVLLSLLAGTLAGALWGLVPGWLRAYLRVNEVVATIMLNYVATLLTEYLVNNPFKDPTAGAPMTRMIPAQEWLGPLLPPSSAHWGLAVALAAVAGVAFLLQRTVWGQNLRFVGQNPRFAEYEGIPVRRMVLGAMLLSGAVAGLGGAVQVLGINHRFIQGFSPDFGFTGITVALLGRINPWGTAAAAFFYAVLINGASIMQQNTSVPYPLVSILQGVLVLFMTAEGVLWLGRRRRRAAPAASAPGEQAGAAEGGVGS
ncbi:MAG: ABC transporter permease [Clostridia bacterium]|nr:ABC transporter permease [Clostridia bacterium]